MYMCVLAYPSMRAFVCLFLFIFVYISMSRALVSITESVRKSLLCELPGARTWPPCLFTNGETDYTGGPATCNRPETTRCRKWGVAVIDTHPS